VKFNVDLDLATIVEVESLFQEYKDVFDGPTRISKEYLFTLLNTGLN
jgi:hypothetical protein